LTKHTASVPEQTNDAKWGKTVSNEIKETSTATSPARSALPAKKVEIASRVNFKTWVFSFAIKKARGYLAF
jgi:hypothetical protein